MSTIRNVIIPKIDIFKVNGILKHKNLTERTHEETKFSKSKD